MKRMIYQSPVNAFCVLMASVFLSYSCKKADTDFNIDKNEYSAGEFIKINNHTKNIVDYGWTLQPVSGGSIYTKTYTDANPQIRINPCAPDGNYTLTLDGKTKKGNSSKTMKEFLVKTTRGTIWIRQASQTYNTSPVEIKIDNEIVGKTAIGRLDLSVAIGPRYVTTSTGKSVTFNVKENQISQWNIEN